MTENDAQPSRFLKWSRICDVLDYSPASLEGACRRHGIPVTQLSPRRRGLTQANFNLLLEKTTRELTA